MGGTIDFPTYIVLELPAPVAAKIRRYRRLFDRTRAQLPTEVTLTGSSGVGLIGRGQSLDDVLALVDMVAAANAPFEAAFDDVEAFTSTDTYYLPFRNPEPFRHLHEAFASSGILFDPTPYPYTPHVTLKLRKKAMDGELSKLLSVKPPIGSFILNTVAVYTLPDMLQPVLLHEARLGLK